MSNDNTHGHSHHRQKPVPLPPQPAPEFDGSTFAQPAPLVDPVQGLPNHFLTLPDIDGCCRFDFVEAKAAELGNPPDYVRLYGWADGAIAAFYPGDMDDEAKAKLQANAHPRNHPWNAPLWQGFRLDVKLPNGNYDQSGKRILPNSMFCIAGTTIEQFKAYIAAQTAENYYKTPYALATAPPQPLGGGL